MHAFEERNRHRFAIVGTNPRAHLILVSTLLIALLAGCDGGSKSDFRETNPPRLPALAALGEGAVGAIVAQGKLEPSGGVLPILVPAGDRIASLEVREGDKVEPGQTLAVLQSESAREMELAVAETQLREAREKAAAEQKVASAKLDVAKIDLAKAELEFQQAEQRFARAMASGGELDLLDQQVELAESKLEQLRRAATDPTAGQLVSQSSLDQQELAVSQARAEAKSARNDAQQSIERGKLSVESARGDIVAAELAIESGKVSTNFESLEQQIGLLRLQLDAVKVRSPIAGTVVTLDATPGQATTGAPLMRVADTSHIVCRAEVNVADIQRFAIGAEARISSPALPRPIAGRVRSVSRMVGAPQLPSPHPMARVDWRSAEVIIDIDPQDAEPASRLIQLQVDVAIEAKETTDDDKPAPSTNAYRTHTDSRAAHSSVLDPSAASDSGRALDRQHRRHTNEQLKAMCRNV